jgi:hypothetical protein
VSHSLFAWDLFCTLSLGLDIFLTLTRLVVVINFVNFSFALFTPPLGDFQFSSFVTEFRTYVRQPGEVRPHKPGLLAYAHEYHVIKKRFTQICFCDDLILLQFTSIIFI